MRRFAHGEQCAERFLQMRPHLIHRHPAVPLRPRTADRHQLNETHLDRMVPRNRRERRDLIVVDARNRHAVHLHIEPRLPGQALQRFHHRTEERAPRDREKLPAVKRIEAEIHRVKPRINQLIEHRAEQNTVRRDGDRLDARGLLQPAHKPRDIAPDKRLAARQAHLADAHLCKCAHIAQNLLVAEHICMR